PRTVGGPELRGRVVQHRQTRRRARRPEPAPTQARGAHSQRTAPQPATVGGLPRRTPRIPGDELIMTATLTSTRPLNPNRVPIGVDSTQQWLELRFSGIENPHILICGGSQTGKTTLQLLAAAVAASRGNIVIILDPKLRFSRAFRDPKTGQPLPNVLVYRDADDAIAAREWHGILAQVTAEMQQRYRGDDQAHADVLDDQARFPNILVVADELGTLLDFADNEWPYRKADGYKGNSPISEMIHTSSRMGAEAHVFGCFANQTAKEDELPAGTKTRSLCGQRI